jgi:hypothetical protein
MVPDRTLQTVSLGTPVNEGKVEEGYTLPPPAYAC